MDPDLDPDLDPFCELGLYLESSLELDQNPGLNLALSPSLDRDCRTVDIGSGAGQLNRVKVLPRRCTEALQHRPYRMCLL